MRHNTEPIRLDELLASLEETYTPQDNGYRTTTELGDTWGCSTSKVRKILKAAQVVDRLSVREAARRGLDGSMRRFITYKILPTPSKTKGEVRCSTTREASPGL